MEPQCVAQCRVGKDSKPKWPDHLTTEQQNKVNAMEKKFDEYKKIIQSNYSETAIQKVQNEDRQSKMREHRNQTIVSRDKLLTEMHEYALEITLAGPAQAGGPPPRDNDPDSQPVTQGQMKRLMMHMQRGDQRMLQNGGDGDGLNQKLNGLQQSVDNMKATADATQAQAVEDAAERFYNEDNEDAITQAAIMFYDEDKKDAITEAANRFYNEDKEDAITEAANRFYNEDKKKAITEAADRFYDNDNKDAITQAADRFYNENKEEAITEAADRFFRDDNPEAIRDAMYRLKRKSPDVVEGLLRDVHSYTPKKARRPRPITQQAAVCENTLAAAGGRDELAKPSQA